MSLIKNASDVTRLFQYLSHQTAQLLNVNGTATDLKHTRPTIERFIKTLETLFLVRTLPAWDRNNAKRLVKTPKIHICDSGIAAYLTELTADQWTEQPRQFGHLLESFILQQLMAEAHWTDPFLKFSHYRDKDKVEVDIVIEKGRKVWGIEIKSGQSIHPSDGKGLNPHG